jgi:predicted lipoprotein with Yx(FWY)xxD motif
LNAHPGIRLSAILLALAGAVAIVVTVASRPAHAATSVATTVDLGKSALGRMLVTSRGRTLYLFEKDRNGRSSCTGTCATFWPPLLTTANPHAGTGVRASLLGTTRRPDGKLQVTYRRHPLYTFALDKRAGQTKGEGLKEFGGGWYAVSAAGTKIDDDTGGGGGYYGG